MNIFIFFFWVGYTCLRPNSTGKRDSENVGVLIALLPAQPEDLRSTKKSSDWGLQSCWSWGPFADDARLVSIVALRICMGTTENSACAVKLPNL